MIANKFYNKLFQITLQVLCWLWVLLNIGACSFIPEQHFKLLPTTSVMETQVAQQQWLIRYADQDYSLAVVVECGAQSWQWIMLNNLGQRLATASVIAGKVKIEQHQSHPLNKLLPDLLEAWQFSYWPLADLQQAGQSRWVFTEYPGRREVYFSAILRATIEYQNKNPWQGSLNYNNSDFQLLIHSQLLN